MTWFFLIGILVSGPLMATTPQASQEPEATCASERECPAGVALLLSNKLDGEIDRCSSFLINSRTLVTNRHCIPEDLQDKMLSCSGRITAVFPKTPGFSSERVECESVLSISKAVENFPVGHPDYAVVLLKRPVKRPIFRISREGLPNRTKLTTYSFDPVIGSSVKAILREKSCESLQNTDLIPGYTDAFSPVASFTGCQIIRGNSGSVAVDDRGHVRAIVHATWPMNKKYLPFSVMTNMACVDLPPGYAPRDSRCDESRPAEFDFKTLFASAPHWDFDQEFHDFQMANRDKFRFKKTRMVEKDMKIVIPQIACLERAALKGLVSFGNPETVITLSLPIWGPDKFITSEYRYKVVPAQFASAYTTVQFDVNQMLTQGRSMAREIRGSYFLYSDQEYELALCD